MLSEREEERLSGSDGLAGVPPEKGGGEAELLSEPRTQPEPGLRELQREIEALKVRLRDKVEECQSQTEELRGTREEFQRINNELTTLNEELQSKLEELSQTNSDLHNLIGAAAIPTVFLDRDLRIMRYTPSAVGLFRFIASDIGRPLGDLRHQIEYPEMSQDALRVLESLTPVEREVRAGEASYLARVLPYRTLDDRIAGVLLALIDVTESKRAAMELRVTEERVRLILESAKDYAIFTIDLERKVTSWNLGAQLMMGYSEAEITGQLADILFVPEDRAKGDAENELGTALREGKAENERWHLRKDGSRRYCSGMVRTLPDAMGKTIGFVKIMRDLTMEKQNAEELQRSRVELVQAMADNEKARKEAVAANSIKDHFLATLSHELRTPLTPILMATESLLRRTDLPERVVEALQMISRSVEVETHLIDDLLDITRISRGTLEMHLSQTDVHTAIQRALEIAEPGFVAKNQMVRVKLEAERHGMRGDFPRLQQVFWNLLINAFKFTPENGTIEVKSRNEGETICVDFSDSGRGIDPNEMSDIFLAFKQGDESVAREYGGLGLGLAISKATVEALGGSIAATSHGRGKGAVFTVKLPLANSSEERRAQ